MDFILWENVEGKEFIMWINDVEKLPSSAIAFTYYQQDNGDENGIKIHHSNQYRIGVPIKFILGDLYEELEYDAIDTQMDDLHSLYIHDKKKLSEPIKRIVKPMNENITLVSNFTELEETFESIIKKEQVRKR